LPPLLARRLGRGAMRLRLALKAREISQTGFD
jgi:hypothetical protein